MSARPAAAAVRPWSSACWPSVADTCVCEISLRLIGRAPMRRLSARSCASLIVADVLDRGAGAAVDPLGVVLVVDRRERDDRVVERDREALEELLGRRPLLDGRAVLGDPGERLAVAPALGDLLRDPGEGLAARVRELHRHERLLGVRVEVLLGVLDLLTGELRVVLDHEEAVHALRLVRRRLALHDHDSLRDLERRASRPAGRPGRAPPAPSGTRCPWRTCSGSRPRARSRRAARRRSQTACSRPRAAARLSGPIGKRSGPNR